MFVLANLLTVALGATCTVDPTLGIPGSFQNIQDAINGPCSAANSTVVVDCPSGCSLPAIVIDKMSGLTIRPTSIPAHEVVIGSPSDAVGVRIIASENINFENIAGIEGVIGLYATESSNIWAGYGGDRYLMLTGVEIGLKAEGSSFYVGNFAIVDSNTALDLDNSSVEGASVVLAGNGSLGYLKGGSSACPASGGSSIVLSSLSPARLNYIRDNESGLEVHGSSSLELDHVVIDGNLRVNPNSSGLANHLIKMEDASHAVFRNIAVYDNDEFDNPGEPSCINCQHSNSPFMRYNTCGDVSFVASTFGDNETEKLIDMDGLGTGNLHLDHVYVLRTPRKVIANSGYWLVYGSCPSITAVGTVFFDNYRYSDPLFCLTGGFQILDLGPSSPGLAAPSNFPSLIPPVTDIYFVTQHEPVVPYALPTGLFDVGNWSGTATTNDVAPLDVGFHSPRP